MTRGALIRRIATSAMAAVAGLGVTAAVAEPTARLTRARAAAVACNYTSAQSEAAAALAEAQALWPPGHIGLALVGNDVATFANERLDFTGAEAAARPALAIAIAADPGHALVGLLHQNLGVALAGRRELDAAEAELRASLRIAVGNRDAARQADVYAALRNLAFMRGDPRRGLEHAQKAADVVRADPAIAPAQVAGILLALSDAQRRQLRLAEAEQTLSQALPFLDRAANPSLSGRAALTRASIALERGRFDAAVVALDALAGGASAGACARELEVDAALTRGSVHLVRREINEARLAFNGAIAATSHLGLMSSTRHAEALYGLAIAASFAGAYGESERLFDRAAALYREIEGPQSMEAGRATLEKAYMLVAAKRSGDAVLAARDAVAAFGRRKDARPIDRTYAKAALAYALGADGKVAAARAMLVEALAEFERHRGQDGFDLAPGLVQLAELELRSGQPARAEPHLRRALAIQTATASNGALALGITYSRIAAALEAQGRRSDAQGANAQAVDVLKTRMLLGERSPTADAQSERLRSREILERELALGLPDQTLTSDLPLVDRMFRTAQLAGALRTGAAVAQMATRLGARGGALSVTLRAREALLDEWRVLDDHLVAAPGGDPRRAEVDLQAAVGRQKQILVELARLDRQLSASFPEFQMLTRPSEASVANARAALRQDEVLVVISSAEAATFVIVVSRTGALAYRVELTGETLDKAVRGLRAGLDPETWPGETPPPFDVAAAYQLHQKLLAPVADLLPPGAKLLIVADGALGSLPFGVLLTAPPGTPPATAAEHRGLAWLARRNSISVLPSVSALVALRRLDGRAGARRPFLGVGDPVFAATTSAKPMKAELRTAFNGRLADTRTLSQLAPLPDTRNELQAMATALGGRGSELLLGAAATEPRVRSAPLREFRIVAFATHGLVAGDLEGFAEPGLVLTPPATASREDDGLLTASEVAGLDLNADWVILSACKTAATDGSPQAEALTGLTKAFFYAGARALLVSHWNVETQATAKLTSTMIQRFSAGAMRSQAAQQAQLAVMDAPDRASWAHPFYWSAFTVVGTD